MKGESSSQASNPVVSQFFTKPGKSQSATAAPGATAKKSTGPAAGQNGLAKQPSIISLSDDDDDDGDKVDKDELQILEVPSKRKAPVVNGASNGNEGNKAKKVRVAPLFEKTKALPAIKREGSPSAAPAGHSMQESLNRLQQFKYTAAPAVANGQAVTLSPAKSAQNGALPTSSPLPDLPKASSSKSDKALEAQRALVRKRLLGFDTSYKRADEGDSPSGEPRSGSDEEEVASEPVASTSRAGKGKDESRASEDKENVPPSTGRFANFASSSKDAGSAIGAKGKEKAAKADLKGKGKANEAEITYTPLEQQVLDIKKRNVSFQER